MQARIRYNTNREHLIEYGKQWRKNSTKYKTTYREYCLKKKYGIDVAFYNYLYEKQGGKCAICKKSFDTLCVDHCHTSNKVRGLLCNNCNSGIGYLEDNVEYLASAISYLKNQ
jgi:hypothetical protein